MANSLGLPDIGLTTLSEVTQFAGNIAKVTSLPTIMDVDTGFGEVMNMVRTIQEVEYAGVAGCHLEDQVNQRDVVIWMVSNWFQDKKWLER